MRSSFLAVLPAVAVSRSLFGSQAACSASLWDIDTDYSNGQGLGHAQASSPADCCTQCSQFPGCKFFTFAPAYVGKECWFKSSNSGKTSNTGVTSGATGVDPPPPAPTPLPPPEDPLVVPVGEPVDVWAAVDTLHECGIIDVPDIPARVYNDGDGITHMIEGSTKFHWMTGPSPLNVTRNCSVAFNMTGDTDPSMMAGDEFLDSPIVFENGTVISLVHTEYPGNVFGNCDGPSYPYCWTVTIGLAVSYDWGNTWQHARPPPHHLVAAVPYQYNQTQLAYGWGDPSNIVRSPKDGHYYVAMWNRNQVGLQAPGICIMRTSDLMDPSSWRAWDGKDFTVSFTSPYTLEPGTEGEHVCTVVNLPAPGCAAMGLVWSTYLEKFVTTLDCNIGSDHFLIATSDDLIHWSEAQTFYSKKDIPSEVSKMVSAMNYPTFIDPTAPTAFADPNFYTIGQEPYLYWASIGHSPYTDGRHLWATQFKFQKNSTMGIELV